MLFLSCSVLIYYWHLLLVKVSNENIRTMWQTCPLKSVHLSIDVIGFVLLYLFIILHRYHQLFWCIHCWLWTSKCRLSKCCLCFCVTSEKNSATMFLGNSPNKKRVFICICYILVFNSFTFKIIFYLNELEKLEKSISEIFTEAAVRKFLKRVF